MIYLATIFSGNLTVPIDPSLEMNTLIYCIDFSDIDILFYETKYQSKISNLKENVQRFSILFQLRRTSEERISLMIEVKKKIMRKKILSMS